MPKYFWIDRNSTLRLRGVEDPVRYGEAFDSKKVDALTLKRLLEDKKIADKLVEAKSTTTLSDIDRVKSVHKAELTALREELEATRAELERSIDESACGPDGDGEFVLRVHFDELKNDLAEAGEKIIALENASTEKSPVSLKAGDDLAGGAGPAKDKK